MRTRTVVVGILVLVAVLLGAGCGAGGTGAMDEKFQQIDFEFSALENVNSAYNDREFESETRKYIALVRKYAPQLGHAEARRRLTEKGDELSSYCLPCVATLNSAALKY
jgi:predicted component of type VI protein secretion system